MRFFFFLCSLTALSAAPLPLSTSYWKSPGFLKEFNGSYRINANIEPVLSSAERGLLVEMQDLMAKGQRTQAISKLKESRLLKNSAAIQFNLANVLSEVGKLDEAINYYKRAIQELPAFLRAQQNLAFAYFRKDQIAEAKPHLLEAVRLGANNGSVHGLLGYSFLQEENYEPALRSFREALITQPNEKDWKLGIGQALHQMNRSNEALALYQQLYREAPEDKEMILQLALLHNERDELAEATTYLELLRRRGTLESGYELLLGRLLISDGNTELGAKALRQVLQSDNFEKADSAIQSVQFCFERGMNDLAFELHGLVKVNDLSQAGQLTYQRLKARILLAAEPNSAEGLQILEGLIARNPLDSYSLLLLGQQRVLAKLNHKALLLFDQAIHADGSHSAQAQLVKAQTLVSLSRYADAVAEVEEYLAGNPGDEKVEAYLVQLKNLAKASDPAAR